MKVIKLLPFKTKLATKVLQNHHIKVAEKFHPETSLSVESYPVCQPESVSTQIFQLELNER